MVRNASQIIRDKYYLLWPGEIAFLKNLADSLPEYPIIVNIGAGKGTSGLAFMEAREDVRLYTIDISQVNHAGDGLQAEKAAFKLAGFPHGEQWWNQTMYDSSEAGDLWIDTWELPLADMVFVDGDHSYGGVKADALSWLSNIKDGGVLAFHDYKTWEVDSYDANIYGPTRDKEVTESVARAVDEVMKGYEVIGRVDTIKAFRIYPPVKGHEHINV